MDEHFITYRRDTKMHVALAALFVADAAGMLEIAPGPGPAKVIPGATVDFEMFWTKVPPFGRSRSSRDKACKVWSKMTIPQKEAAFAGLETWKACWEWTKDGGQFVPGIHRWLTDRKWNDEPAPPPAADPRTVKRQQWDAEIEALFVQDGK